MSHPGSLFVILFAAMTFGCAMSEPTVDREDVDRALAERVGHRKSATPLAPSDRGVRWDDGLDLREAGAVALAHNPDFLAALSELGVEQARFVQAGLLQNPILSVLFPLGPKQFEATLQVFVDALWERPRRLDVAASRLEAVAEDLVRHGLATYRDAQLAMIEFVRLRELQRHVERLVDLLDEQLALEERRYAAGDATTIDVGRARLAMERARTDAIDLDVQAGETVLDFLLILGDRSYTDDVQLALDLSTPPEPRLPSRQAAVAAAQSSRPDVRAAELLVERAEAACRLAEVDIASVAIIPDANGKGDEGFEASPGLRLELPVFDHGQGRRALARAELARAILSRKAILRRVEGEVVRAWMKTRASRLTVGSTEAALSAATDVERRVRAGRAGGTHTDVDVLEAAIASTRQRIGLTDARARAWTSRVHAEFAIGRRIDLVGAP